MNFELNICYDFFETSVIVETVHLFLLDTGLATGVGGGLHVHDDGKDLVAEALLGEAADLKVAGG